MTEQLEGQMSIFDCFDQSIWYGRTSQAHFHQEKTTKERTSELSSKKQRGSSIKTPLYLNLRRGGGVQAVASWETGGVLLGEYMMHSFGEYPKEENVSLLSQILEDHPHPKYCLSARACQGILNRAEKRGKKLPEILETALKNQILRLTPSKSEGGVERDSSGKRAGKGALVQTELSGTLGVSQDQTLITCVSDDLVSSDGNIAGTLDASYYKGTGMRRDRERTVVLDKTLCIGNGQVNDAVQPDDEICKTLNCMVDPMKIVTYGVDFYNQSVSEKISMPLRNKNADSDHIPCVTATQNDVYTVDMGAGKSSCDVLDNKSPTLATTHYGEPAVCYGLDRASFNQGQNALYNFSIEEELAQTIVAKGAGGGNATHKTVGALCARDYKGEGSQYVEEGKCIIQRFE